MTAPEPGPVVGEWLTQSEAAALLGLTAGQVGWLARRGHLTAHRTGRTVSYPREEVARYAARHDGWISYNKAAELAGCSHTAVGRAVKRGVLVRRPGLRQHPCLSLDSVTRWASELREQRARAKADYAREAERRHRARQPPEEEGVWLTLETAARVMGLSRSSLAGYARRERLPATRVGHRWWFRRDHIESAAAARAFARRQRAALDQPA